MRKPVSSRLRTVPCHERADAIDDARQFIGLLPGPGHDARRAEPPRAEQILHGLGGPVLRNELLRDPVDRHGFDARAI
jgi:hypothetical protein